MNENNPTALIQKVYAAFGRGDVQTILDHLAPDVEWTLDGPAIIPYAGALKGPSEVRGFFESLATTQDNQRLTIDEYITQGDDVVTTGRYAATVKATGKKIDSAIGHVFTVKNGAITRFLNFADTAQMADAYTIGAAQSAA
jgi:ketosteroid isomerase-like protein